MLSWREGCVAVAMIFVTEWAVGVSPAASISVHFDKDTYVVSGPGETVDAVVLIDGLGETPEDDPIAGGLFSAAVRISFNSAKAQVSGAGDVSVPAELDNFGFSSGALREVTAGLAGVKGNVGQNVSPLEFYGGSTLATFHLTNLASAPDSYPLQLEFFRTLGPNEQFFVDGSFSVIDADIQFGSARVLVIPEPASSTLIVAGVLACFLALRRRDRT